MWAKSDTEAFMERLWAYKRINYLLDTPALSDPTKLVCEKGIDETPLEYPLDIKIPNKFDRCEKEAVRLALKFNFVTDLTSMVVEETDEYTTKRNLEEKKVQPKDDNQYSYGGNSHPPQSNRGNRISSNPKSNSNHNSYPYPTNKPYNPYPTRKPYNAYTIPKPYNPYPTHKPYNPYTSPKPYNPYQKSYNPYPTPNPYIPISFGIPAGSRRSPKIAISSSVGSRINHISTTTTKRYAN